MPKESADSAHPFGVLLRRYRTLAGLTQESLAERAGISTRAVSDLERGINHTPRAETLDLLAAALRLAPADRATLIAAAHPDVSPDVSPSPASTSMPLSASSSRLPLPPNPLIGRETDLRRGLHLLQHGETRLLTLVGPGGVGKTHLALEIARQSEGRFAAGARFVDLSATHDAALVPAALAQTLELREPPTGAMLPALASALRDQPLLLLLDNLEQVIDCAPLLADLLAACPHLALLVTSRTPLRLRAEHILDLAPLALPDAAALFRARVAALGDDLPLPAEDVAALCQQVDCLPLAIELCAAQLGALPLADLRQRLAAGMALPRGGALDLPERQRTLRQTIGWSYDLLPASAQTLFRRLAVFAGGCTLPAVTAVCAPEDEPAYDPAPDLTALVDASLLRLHVVAGGSARYEMLATIADYARERLTGSGEREPMAHRHAAYFASLEGDEAALEREMPNARAAFNWARDSGATTIGFALQARFGRSWYISGLRSELRGWIEAFLELDEASEHHVPAAARASAYFGAARLAFDRGEVDAAEALAEQSLGTAREGDDYENMSNALAMLGQIAQDAGDVERAGRLFEQCLAAARKSQKPHALSVALGNYAQTLQAQGDLERAVALTEETLVISRQIGSLWGEALTQTHLGLLAFARQRYAEARQHYASALALYRNFGSDVYLVWCLEGLVALDVAEGACARAVEIGAGAETLRCNGNAPRPSGEQQTFEQALARCQDALGAERYQRAWENGSGLARDGLIGRALGEMEAAPGEQAAE